MDTGTCYVFESSDGLVSFPLLSCSDGDSLQLDSPTSAEYYKIIGGRIFKVRERVVDSSDFDVGLVLHTWPDNGRYFLDMNSAIIPATFLLALFFIILYRWFIRLRG